MRRPSPALVIAFLALIGAWGGPAVAQSLIGSKDIKDQSIRGRDVRPNTITGRNVKGLTGRDILRNGLDGSDINEDTLDEVPNATRARRATQADSATHADTAGALDGASVRRISYAQAAGNGTATVYEGGGLRLQASCSAQGTLTATAAPAGTGRGIIRVQAERTGSSSLETDNDFGGTDALSLVDGGASDLSGRLTFWSADGDVVTVQYLAQDGLGASRSYACALAGTAVHTAP